MFTDATFLSLALIAITLPLVVSIAVATKPEARPRGVRDYFLFDKKLSASDFRRTSVGYSLQAAAIFLFLYWTFAYGLSSVFVPICWLGGYLLLFSFYKRGYLDSFLQTKGETRTIHGFFRDLLPVSLASKILVKLAIISTLFGIGGTMVAEADYVMNWLVASLSLEPGIVGITIQIGTAFILGFAILYVLWGGYRAVIITDKFQVPLAYSSFGLFTILVALSGVLSLNSGWSFLALVAIILIFGALTVVQNRLTMGSQDPLWSRAPVFMGLSVAAVIALAISLTVVLGDGIGFDTNALPSRGHGFAGFGVIGVISLVVANVVWQIIDISSLQRLQSVSEKALSSAQEDRTIIKEAIFASGIESASAWFLIIVAGIALYILGVAEPFAVAETLRSEQLPPVIGMFAIFLFLFSLSAFAISTIDAFVSAMAYVSFFDVLDLKSERSNGEASDPLRSAKWVTIFASVSIVAGYYVLKALSSSEELPQILYAIYAVQLSIFPLIIDAFVWGRVHLWGALAAIPLGWFVALWTAMSPPQFGIFPDSWYIIPPLAVCLITSAIYFLIRFLMRNR